MFLMIDHLSLVLLVNTIQFQSKFGFSSCKFIGKIKILARSCYLLLCIRSRDSSRDGCIKKCIKGKWSSGLFWAGGAAEKKKLPIAISMQLLGVVFSTFWVQNFFLKNWKKKFWPQKVEKTTPKSCILMAVGRFFFSAAPPAQTAKDFISVL